MVIKFPLGRNLANKDKCCKETILSVQRSDISPTEGVDERFLKSTWSYKDKQMLPSELKSQVVILSKDSTLQIKV